MTSRPGDVTRCDDCGAVAPPCTPVVLTFAVARPVEAPGDL
jgi:hypothetical protein